MEIQIHIPRPWQTLCAVLLVFLWITGPFNPFGGTKAPQGMGGNVSGVTLAQAQQTVDRERIRQAVLTHREEILRYQLHVLEDEAARTQDKQTAADVREHRKVLLGIIAQRKASEALLTRSLSELWDAQGTEFSQQTPDQPLALLWPVEPKYGISAHFEDDAYETRFGIPHHAVDIPTEQGTVIRAPADGVVSKVSLNGLGYSYLVVDHGNGVQTIYGHISGALVQEGDRVRTGSPIALSGGRPGSEGAGLLTTGPHLHWAVRQDGKLVDPMKYVATFVE